MLLLLLLLLLAFMPTALRYQLLLLHSTHYCHSQPQCCPLVTM
jgi:hypothetical protein